MKYILYDSLREEFFGIEQSFADGMITETYFWEEDYFKAYTFTGVDNCIEILTRHYQDVENPKLDAWYIVPWAGDPDFSMAFPFMEGVDEYYAVR